MPPIISLAFRGKQKIHQNISEAIVKGGKRHGRTKAGVKPCIEGNDTGEGWSVITGNHY